VTTPQNRPPTPLTHTRGFAFALLLGLFGAWVGIVLLAVGMSYPDGGGVAVLGGLTAVAGLLTPVLFWRDKRRRGTRDDRRA
jgi:membrane protein implicated in regulation of membrane protease activity